MAAPDLFRTVRLLDAPQINVLANARYCYMRTVLPFDLKSFESWVQLHVVEPCDILALNDVPNRDLSRVPTRGNKVSSAFIELRVHQHHIKILDVLDFNLRAVRVLQFPDACHHVRRTCYQSVTLAIPVHRTYICSDLRELTTLNVRK